MAQAKADIYKTFQIPEPEPFGTQLSVLVADPQTDRRLIFMHHLQKQGFSDIRAAKDGFSVLEELRQRPASLLILSNEFEGPLATDVVQEIREDINLQRDVVILVSYPLKKNEIMYALETGFDDILIKPIVMGEIMPKLRSAYSVFSSHKNPERIYELAKTALRTGDFSFAERIYLELAKQTQFAARPFVGLAHIAVARNEKDAALLHVQEAIKRNKNYVHAHALLGDIYVASGRVDDALKCYKTAIELSPLNVIRYQVASDVLLGENRIDDAISILEIANEAGLESHFIFARLGECYFKKKDYNKAIRYLRRAVNGEPDNLSFQNSLAICHRDAGEFEEALSVYNLILRKDNDNC
ncbi:MAG: hypothetical protein RJB13_275, partial [Pseudomonadota bacterium]